MICYPNTKECKEFILDLVSDGAIRHRSTVRRAIGDAWGLTPEQQKATFVTGAFHDGIIKTRVGDALYELKKEGKIEYTGEKCNVAHGYVKATQSYLNSLKGVTPAPPVKSRYTATYTETVTRVWTFTIDPTVDAAVEPVEVGPAPTVDKGIGGELYCGVCGCIIPRPRVDAGFTDRCVACSNVAYRRVV